MSRVAHNAPFERVCFPRVSGDEPGGSIEIVARSKFSPRERG